MDLSWRVRRGWPYYLLQREGGRRHMKEKEKEKDTGLKSGNPNLQG